LVAVLLIRAELLIDLEKEETFLKFEDERKLVDYLNGHGIVLGRENEVIK